MPADLNAAGDVFGGWLLSQMDLAAGRVALRRARNRTATVAITAMKFHRPMHLGDELTCYCRLSKIGRTSLTIHVEAWARHDPLGEEEKITEGEFVFVSIDKNGKPQPIPDELT
jgi:acyl-CoA thioesterase YciA